MWIENPQENPLLRVEKQSITGVFFYFEDAQLENTYLPYLEPFNNKRI